MQAILGAVAGVTVKIKIVVSHLTPLFYSHPSSNLLVDSVSASFKIDPNSGDLSHFLDRTPFILATRAKMQGDAYP